MSNTRQLISYSGNIVLLVTSYLKFLVTIVTDYWLITFKICYNGVKKSNIGKFKSQNDNIYRYYDGERKFKKRGDSLQKCEISARKFVRIAIFKSMMHIGTNKQIKGYKEGSHKVYLKCTLTPSMQLHVTGTKLFIFQLWEYIFCLVYSAMALFLFGKVYRTISIL